MKLTVMQTAEKLGISRTQVHTLVKNGHLTDLKPKVEGAKKHFSLLDSVQVNQFAKEYKVRGTRRVLSATNSTQPEPMALQVDGVMTRLARLEEKIDQLLTLWR